MEQNSQRPTNPPVLVAVVCRELHWLRAHPHSTPKAASAAYLMTAVLPPQMPVLVTPLGEDGRSPSNFPVRMESLRRRTVVCC